MPRQSTSKGKRRTAVVESAGTESRREDPDPREELAELSKGNQDARLLRTAIFELRNNNQYGEKAMRLVEHLAREVEALKVKESGNEGGSDRAAKRRERELHEQDLKERETERADRSRERNLFMNLTVFVVVASVLFGGLTVVFMVLTAKYSQPWGYAGSAVGLALTIVTGFGASRGLTVRPWR